MKTPTALPRLLLISTVLASTLAIGADADYQAIRTSVLDQRFPSDGARRAGDSFLRLNKATEAYLALGATATSEQKAASHKAAIAALRDYEAAIPGAKTDVAAMVDALKKAGTFKRLDAQIYANPAAFGTTPAELRALKAAGGPQAVLSNVGPHFDDDIADFRRRLAADRTAIRFNLSPIPEAHAGFFCSLAAWTMKTATCWWDQPCYNHWASSNNRNCQR